MAGKTYEELKAELRAEWRAMKDRLFPICIHCTNGQVLVEGFPPAQVCAKCHGTGRRGYYRFTHAKFLLTVVFPWKVRNAISKLSRLSPR